MTYDKFSPNVSKKSTYPFERFADYREMERIDTMMIYV